jgi:hypothetical protein
MQAQPSLPRVMDRFRPEQGADANVGRRKKQDLHDDMATMRASS